MARVELENACTANFLPTQRDFELWVNAALPEHHQDKEVSICLVDEDQSQALNNEYRDKDKPTNVLSFPCELPEGVDVPLIGDLVICAGVVAREAEEQNKAVFAHWAHMVVHGCLHLIGYDHIDDAEAEEMEALETRILEALGYPAPYNDN